MPAAYWPPLVSSDPTGSDVDVIVRDTLSGTFIPALLVPPATLEEPLKSSTWALSSAETKSIPALFSGA
jgi:hypothetical protein